MDEENNNVDDEDDEDEEEEMQPISIRASTPADNFIEDDDPDIEDFPQGVDNEVVVDNDEDVRVNVSREGDVEIVGEDIAVEIIAERAIVPDTEDDTDDDIADDDEYPLPVINTATTEEVLGISSDSDTGGTVEAAEDTLEAGAAAGAASREMSPVPGPSTSGQHQSVVRCSRGKRLPWRDTDYNDTSDSEEDEVRGPDPSPGSREAAVVTPAVGVITTPASSYGGIIIQPSRELTSVPRSRGLTDFNERRFWRQLSSNNEDLGSIEPTVSSSSTPELRVRSVSSLQPSWWRRRPTPPPPLVMTISPATSSQPAPSRQGEEGAGSSSSVPTLPNTTIRRILPINTTDLVPAPAPPAPVEPARLEAVRSPSPVSPPQSAMYSPVQLPTFPPVNAPRFEPGDLRARVEEAAPRDPRARVVSRESIYSITEEAAPRARNTEMLDRIRDGARDLDRIDRILELSRRSRVTAELESERRREAERTRREWLTDLQRERELTERTIYTGRRSLERAETVMSRGRDTGDREERSWARARALRALHAEHPAVYLGGQRVRTQEDDVTNEFVRDTTDNEDAEDTPPASKRPRVDGDQPSSQYDADMAEALSRSLADQGGATTTTATARDAELEPGCSHWSKTSGTPVPALDADTAATADATVEDEEENLQLNVHNEIEPEPQKNFEEVNNEENMDLMEDDENNIVELKIEDLECSDIEEEDQESWAEEVRGNRFERYKSRNMPVTTTEALHEKTGNKEFIQDFDYFMLKIKQAAKDTHRKARSWLFTHPKCYLKFQTCKNPQFALNLLTKFEDEEGFIEVSSPMEWQLSEAGPSGQENPSPRKEMLKHHAALRDYILYKLESCDLGSSTDCILRKDKIRSNLNNVEVSLARMKVWDKLKKQIQNEKKDKEDLKEARDPDNSSKEVNAAKTFFASQKFRELWDKYVKIWDKVQAENKVSKKDFVDFGLWARFLVGKLNKNIL